MKNRVVMTEITFTSLETGQIETMQTDFTLYLSVRNLGMRTASIDPKNIRVSFSRKLIDSICLIGLPGDCSVVLAAV